MILILDVWMTMQKKKKNACMLYMEIFTAFLVYLYV